MNKLLKNTNPLQMNINELNEVYNSVYNECANLQRTLNSLKKIIKSLDSINYTSERKNNLNLNFMNNNKVLENKHLKYKMLNNNLNNNLRYKPNSVSNKINNNINFSSNASKIKPNLDYNTKIFHRFDVSENNKNFKSINKKSNYPITSFKSIKS